jgi:hypothetical protein
MDAARRKGEGAGSKGLVTLVVEPAGARWEARAFGAALGAKAGRRIGTYGELEAAIREASDYGRQIEARGYAVHLAIKGREGEPNPRPPLPAPR